MLETLAPDPLSVPTKLPLVVLPVTANAVNVPTEVILVCAAVVNVPTILVPLKLPPVILPVAEINPPVKTLPPVTLPDTDTLVRVPTEVMLGCAAVVTVPAVVAAPVSAPTNVVLVTLVRPATVVTVEPNVSAVDPSVTAALASRA